MPPSATRSSYDGGVRANWSKWRHKIKYHVFKFMAFLGYKEPYMDYRLRRYAAMAAVLMEDRCEKNKIPIKIIRIDMSGSAFYAFEFKYLNRRRGITAEMIKKILDEKKDVYVNENKILITK